MKIFNRQNAAGGERQMPRVETPDVFVGGPPLLMQRRLGLISPGRQNTACRMALAALLAWVPLVLFSLLHDWSGANAFLFDFNSHARYLIAVPLLIAAESVGLPRLGMLAENFRKAGLVAPADHALFNDAIDSTRRLLNSAGIETAIVVVSYLLMLLAYLNVPHAMYPEWARSVRHAHTLTPAGWWAVLVSLPLLIMLLLGWVWRLCLWTRFLWRMSNLNLRLVTVHPDGAAGIGFVGYSSQAFMLLACALGTLAAGRIANDVVAGNSFHAHLGFVAIFVVCIVLALNAPLLVFMRHLLHAWRRGTLEYGALAEHFGREFERKWINRAQPLDSKVLEMPDFSAATDLYQVVDRTYDMWMIPVHLKSTILLAVSALLPFIPVALMSVPFDVLIDKLAGLVF